MTDVYTHVPTFEGDRYRLRFLKQEDCTALLRVYSDEKAVPFFNSDNCGGDDFHYTTEARMAQAIAYWLWEDSRRGFVRWTIAERTDDSAVGTIELFKRQAQDAYNNCGILRIDLRSDHETRESVREILGLIVPPAYALFECDRIAVKAHPAAKERIAALLAFGFSASPEPLIGGNDGTAYSGYYVKNRETGIKKSVLTAFFK